MCSITKIVRSLLVSYVVVLLCGEKMYFKYIKIKLNWQENCVYETVVPPLEERDFEKTVTPIVQEYFEHADANEVAVSVVVLYSTFVLTLLPPPPAADTSVRQQMLESNPEPAPPSGSVMPLVSSGDTYSQRVGALSQ